MPQSFTKSNNMHLNADFDQSVLIHFDDQPWKNSPMPGVERKMLDRIGEEKARATSLVRYAPGSRFSSHVHHGGEEFLVLEGVFQDEHGDYPAGSYLRNPPQSRHTPGSESGCIIFVKLWQFDPDDRNNIRLHTTHQDWQADPTKVDIAIKTLHKDTHETVRLERWPAGSVIERDVTQALECLVLRGGFQFDNQTLEKWSWLRLPVSYHFKALVGDQGCELWCKSAAHHMNLLKL